MTEDAILRPPSSSPNITFSFSFRLYISQVPSVWHLHSYLTHSAISPLVPPVLSYFIFSPYVYPLLSIKHLRHDRGPDSMKHSIRGVSELPQQTKSVFIHCNHSSILQIYTFTYQIKQCFSNSGAPLFRVAKGIPRSKQGTENRLILPEKRGSRTKLI